MNVGSICGVTIARSLGISCLGIRIRGFPFGLAAVLPCITRVLVRLKLASSSPRSCATSASVKLSVHRTSPPMLSVPSPMIQWARAIGVRSSPMLAGRTRTHLPLRLSHRYHRLSGWRSQPGAVNRLIERVTKEYWITVLPACWGSEMLGQGMIRALVHSFSRLWKKTTSGRLAVDCVSRKRALSAPRYGKAIWPSLSMDPVSALIVSGEIRARIVAILYWVFRHIR